MNKKHFASVLPRGIRFEIIRKSQLRHPALSLIQLALFSALLFGLIQIKKEEIGDFPFPVYRDPLLLLSQCPFPFHQPILSSSRVTPSACAPRGVENLLLRAVLVRLLLSLLARVDVVVV